MNTRDPEATFFIAKDIMTLEEYKKLNNSRENLDLQLLIGIATDDELFEQIKIEISIFVKCHKIIERENADNCTKLFRLMLFDRINTMFAYLFHLFPINAKHVQEYMQLCSNHISLLSSLPTILKKNNLIK